MRHMVTVVGRDRPGIVAALARALYEAGCNLAEASMIRLAGTFTVMVVVEGEADAPALEAALGPAAERLGLRVHVDPVEAEPGPAPEPDVRVTVSGADRAGIVARVAGALAEAGVNILDLESAVAEGPRGPIYILHIEGQAARGLEPVREAMAAVAREGIDVSVRPVEPVVG